MPSPHTPITADQVREAERARPEMLNVQQVAEMLGCSTRHIHRLSSDGRMPSPRKIGTLVRWQVDDIEHWINTGCPSTTPKNGGRP